MAKPTIQQHPQQIPGVCWISGINKGPFIDTGRFARGHGRVYISLRSIENLLADLGYVKPDELRQLEESGRQAVGLHAQVLALQGELRRIREAVGGPEREVQVVSEKIVQRDPTDEEIELFIKRRNVARATVPTARPGFGVKVEDDRTEEQKAKQAPLPTQAPAQYFDLHDQKLDLDAVLDHSLKAIRDVIEDNEDTGLPEALVAREKYRARINNTEPRKGLLALDAPEDES